MRTSSFIDGAARGAVAASALAFSVAAAFAQAQPVPGSTTAAPAVTPLQTPAGAAAARPAVPVAPGALSGASSTQPAPGVLTVTLPSAQGPTGPLSLAQVLQTARANLDVTLARQGVTAARADILAANRAPYPVLSARASEIDLQNGVGGGSPLQKRIEKSVGLDWTIERGNKRELRTAAAQRIAEATEADVADILVQQQLGALGAYFDLLAAQQRIDEVREVARSAAVLADTAERRVSAGDLAARDASRTQIEAQRTALDLRNAQLDRDRAAVGLGQFLGTASPLALAADAVWPSTDAADRAAVDVTALIERRADVRAADARLAAAQALLDGALASRKADVTVGASFEHYPGTSNRRVELRAQMPLFWGYAQQGEIARAQAVLTQAQSSAARTRLFASSELQRLRQEAFSAAARTRSYESDILPRARRVAEQAELAFRRGALSLTDVLDARRTLRTTLIEALAARAEHAKAEGAWQLRTQPSVFGLPPEDAPLGATAVPAGVPSTAGPATVLPAVPAPATGPTVPATRPTPATGATDAPFLPTAPSLPATPPSVAPVAPAPLPGPAPAPSPRPGDAAATTPLRGTR